jgi:ATP-binding cassette subfamily B protein
MALAAALVGALAALCRYCFRALNARGAETLVMRMRDGLFSRILHLPYAWHGENNAGDIIQRCTSDVQTVKRFVAEQLTALVRTLILLAMAVAFMAGISVRSPSPPPPSSDRRRLLLLFLRPHRELLSSGRDEEEGKLSAIAQENLTGVRVVRAFGRERYERDRFAQQNETYTAFWVRLIRLLSAFWASGTC